MTFYDKYVLITQYNNYKPSLVFHRQSVATDITVDWVTNWQTATTANKIEVR